MIKNLAHVCTLSRDLAATERFYCEILGLRRQFDFHKDHRLFGFYLRISDRQFIEVFLRGEGEPAKGNLVTHLCLEVDDVAAVRQRLIEHGFKPTEPKLGADQSWQIWCNDPDGVPVEFHQYTEQSSQFTGRPCVVTW
jgi:catechol 2,3-dioxygenase-like lactoylglutathione lyase family enzyme